MASSAVLVATDSILGVYEGVLFYDHMIQHLLLIMVAAPLLAMGAPAELLERSTTGEAHQIVDRCLSSKVAEVVAHPVVDFVLYAFLIPLCHLTNFFNLTLEHPTVQFLEHVMFLVVGYLFWRHVVAIEPSRHRLHPGVRLVFLALAVPIDTFTGLTLASTSHEVFSAYLAQHRSWGPSPVLDLHIGGDIMWVGGDTLMFLGMAPVAVLWVRHEERRGDRARPTARRGSAAGGRGPRGRRRPDPGDRGPETMMQPTAVPSRWAGAGRWGGDGHRTSGPKGAVADRVEVTLAVAGMTCGACAARIERRLNRMDGVSARVNLASERAAVVIEGPVRVERVIEEVAAAGYSARSVGESGTATVTDDELERRARTLGRRLVVAAVLFMPLCDLSIAFWLVPTLRFPGWQWLVIALAAPVVGWAAWPFYVGAVRSARHRTMTMDTLVSIGILASVGWSLYAMFWRDAGPRPPVAPVRAVARERWLHLHRRGRRGDHLSPGRPVLRGGLAATRRARPPSARRLVGQGRLCARRGRHRAPPPDLRARRR